MTMPTCHSGWYGVAFGISEEARDDVHVLPLDSKSICCKSTYCIIFCKYCSQFIPSVKF